MPKLHKSKIREAFRSDCMKRDNEKCVLCATYNKTSAKNLEVHHITNRKQMPNGGYVKQNGITLCPRHHLKVETDMYSYPPSRLYELIASSYEEALDASQRL